METLLKGYVAQQGAIWQSLLREKKEITESFAELVKEKDIDCIFIIGSGSSHYGANMAKPAIEKMMGCEVRCLIPSEFRMEYHTSQHPLYLAISQSGISTNTFEIVQGLREKGHMVIALTEHLDSPIAGKSSLAVELRIGSEVIGAKTKGVSATVMTLLMLFTTVAKDASYASLVQQGLEQAAAQIEENLTRARAWSAQHYEELKAYKHYFVIGSHETTGCAQEIALKLLETTWNPVSYYPLDEYVHGIQNALGKESCMILMIPQEKAAAERMLRLISFARECGAKTLAVSSMDLKDPDIVTIQMPQCKELASLVQLPVMQTLTADLSDALGIDTSKRRYPNFFTYMGSKME